MSDKASDVSSPLTCNQPSSSVALDKLEACRWERYLTRQESGRREQKSSRKVAAKWEMEEAMLEGPVELEGQRLEFKHDWNDSVKKTVVAFANSDGVRIVVGVDDDDTPVDVYIAWDRFHTYVQAGDSGDGVARLCRVLREPAHGHQPVQRGICALVETCVGLAVPQIAHKTTRNAARIRACKLVRGAHQVFKNTTSDVRKIPQAAFTTI